jgi:hypothetical protein
MQIQKPMAEVLASGSQPFFSSTNSIAVLPFVSEHRHKTSIRTSTVYKCVREHYPISNENRGAREYQVENLCSKASKV